MNQLPEKLMMLRRHYHISQQQIASFCHVDLVEYMGWENGRSVPSDEQYALMAELFHLTIDEMKSDSLDVPLQKVNAEDMESTEMLESEHTEKKVHKISEKKSAERLSDDQENWIDKLKDWKTWTIAAVILLVCFSLVLIFKKPENTLNGIEVNNRILESERLASGKDFVLILNSDGTVSGRGNNNQGQLNVDSWKSIASIAAGDAFSAGLRKDGTVIACGSDRYGQTQTQNLSEIVEISAGAEHLAALKADGTVVCLGDNSEGQCEVSQWTDIVTVSAAKSSTLGLKSDGTIVFAGKMDVDTEDFLSWTKVKKLYNGQTQVLALTENATVYCTASSGYNVCSTTENWTDVISIKTAGNHAAALHNNGKVSTSGDDSDGQDRVEQLRNVVSIAAGPDYLVTLNRNNELIGAGNNEYQQFEKLETEENTPLQMVSEITVSIDSQVNIHWSEVSGADYYVICIPEIGYSANVADLSAVLSLDRFVNEAVYTVGITALTMDHSREPSQEALTTFTFFAQENYDDPDLNATPAPTPSQGTIVPTPTPEPIPTPEITPEVTLTPEPTPAPESSEQPDADEEQGPETTEQPEDNQNQTETDEEKSE